MEGTSACILDGGCSYWRTPTPMPMRQSCRMRLAVLLFNVLSLLSLRAASDGSLTLTNVSVLPKGGVHLQSSGPPRLVYSLQRSSDLREWRTIDFIHAESGHATFDALSAASSRARFYRVRAEPLKSSVSLTNYHGWTNSIVLDNGTVRTMIAPAVGRIM